MNDEELQIFQKLRDDYPHYARCCLKIRLKVEGDDSTDKIVPFEMNRAQKYIHAKVEEQRTKTGKVRAIILKGRQQGCSTYIEGRFYWRVTHEKGVRAFILTHEEEATANLFEMVKRYHDNCPIELKPQTQASNSKELIFGKLDSGYKLGTAGNKSVGRSSTIQFLHASEAAFYKHADEHAKGIMQTVPTGKGTEVFIESTANGVGNWFHQQWQQAESGQSDFIAIFVPWFWQDEYSRQPDEGFTLTEDEIELVELYGLRNDQLAWRRVKIQELSVSGIDGVKSFKQEYPCNAVEAFQLSGEDSFIAPEIVMRARKGKAEKFGPLLMGVDPARFGDDRTAIIFRQGRVAFDLTTYRKKDTMEVTGIVHTLMRQYNPTKVFIDVGGLGAGIYDRLMEFGYGEQLVAVNSASKPLNDKRFTNKRSEMWHLGKEWLLDEPVQIPDLDSLHADLCSTKYKPDSNGRIYIEKKEDMKRRGIRSSDEADALLLTFAQPVAVGTMKQTIVKKQAEALTSLAKQVRSLRAKS